MMNTLWAQMVWLVVVGSVVLLPSRSGAVEDSTETVVATQVITERLTLGRAAMAQRDFVFARKHFARILELDWNNPQVYDWWCAAQDSLKNQLSRLLRHADRLFAAGVFPEALVEYHQALSLDSTRIDLQRKIRKTGRKIYARRFLLRAHEFYLNDNDQAALACLDSATIYDRDEPQVLALASRINSRHEQQTEQPELQSDPTAWSKHLAALKNYREGDYHQAISRWEEILLLYPGNPDALANIRQARLRLEANGEDQQNIADRGDG